MSLQSRFLVRREGESGKKNSYGDPLSLVECAAVASFVKYLSKHRRIPRSPAESFVSVHSMPRYPLRDAQKRYIEPFRAVILGFYVTYALLHSHKTPREILPVDNNRSASFPGQIMAGTEDGAVIAPVRHVQRLIVPFVKCVTGIVAATTQI